MTSKAIYILSNLIMNISWSLGYKIVLLISITFLCSTTVIPQQKTESDNQEVYGVAFLRTMFLNADYNDAKAAIKVYVQNLQDQLLTGFSMRPVYFENTDDLLKNYTKENLAVISLSSVDYLAYKSKLMLNPVIVNSGKTDPMETYLILIRQDEKIKGLEDLTDMKFGMLPKENDPIPIMWLNVILSSGKTAKTDKPFSNIVTDKTESQLILSLFFGKLDACLVSKTAYETMVEINPQIGIRIKVLNSSPRYLRVVASFTSKFKKSRFSEGLLQHLTSLDNYAAGRQLFALTKTAKIVPFKEEYLENVKALISDYNKITKHLIK
jgi:phosphonate transport system substrate-binding protein